MAREITGRKLTDHSDLARVLDEGTWDTRPCVRVEVHFHSDHDNPGSIIWIDRDQFLIRRIDDITTIDDLVISRLTAYSPVIDEPIPGHALEFSAPA
jgi:hypothetical protein